MRQYYGNVRAIHHQRATCLLCAVCIEYMYGIVDVCTSHALTDALLLVGYMRI